MERLEYWGVPDHQREKLYRAEKVLPDSWRDDLDHLKTVPQVEAWVKGIIREPWFRYRWPHIKTCRVETPNRKELAMGEFDGRDCANLSLPRWCRTEIGVLHELAHCCVPPILDRPSHGPEYAGAYLFLVEKVRGPEEAAMLRESFKKYGVKYRTPRKGYSHRRRATRRRGALHTGV